MVDEIRAEVIGPKKESEKMFVVITVARQIDGEYVLIRTEKAFRQASGADAFLRKLKSGNLGPDGKPKPVALQTEHGTVNCMCEIGAFEVEIE